MIDIKNGDTIVKIINGSQVYFYKDNYSNKYTVSLQTRILDIKARLEIYDEFSWRHFWERFPEEFIGSTTKKINPYKEHREKVMEVFEEEIRWYKCAHVGILVTISKEGNGLKMEVDSSLVTVYSIDYTPPIIIFHSPETVISYLEKQVWL